MIKPLGESKSDFWIFNEICKRLGLANYFAAATVLPYRQFHEVAEKFRYDVERLSASYAVSFETIAHRLSTLQRPSMRGEMWNC